MSRVPPQNGSPPRAWGGPRPVPGGRSRGRLTPTCVGRTVTPNPPAPDGQAHPHVRGEDVSGSGGNLRPSGSPPRAWGGHSQLLTHHPPSGLTPTCVGRTVAPPLPRPVVPAHPHVRGEDPRYRRSRWPLRGSPPRAWGGPLLTGSSHTRNGLTPTCVGRTALPWMCRSQAAAHPHVRGEDRLALDVQEPGRGSPPRAWGGHPTWRPLWPSRGLTPTCVGRTPAAPARFCSWSAHPHVRGEDVGSRLGSSLAAWLTPTCVGRTNSFGIASAIRTAHPHVRGEDMTTGSNRDQSDGSPPRAWGGRDPTERVAPVVRLTPTCVGRTVRPRGHLGRRWLTPTCVGRTITTRLRGGSTPAHPHVRGEDIERQRAEILAEGSPPRAWGGRAPARAAPFARGLTPTCVGRTPSMSTRARRPPAHPHVRGEDAGIGPTTAQIPGSPPRAWGGPGVVWFEFAGATAHPHVRGEDSIRWSSHTLASGSPPRAWGGPRLRRQPRDGAGLTPTCVGRTACCEGSAPRRRAHPHVRGEDRARSGQT